MPVTRPPVVVRLTGGTSLGTTLDPASSAAAEGVHTPLKLNLVAYQESPWPCLGELSMSLTFPDLASALHITSRIGKAAMGLPHWAVFIAAALV